MKRISTTSVVVRGGQETDLPTLSALRVLETLSRHPTMRSAGEELGITHAAISTTLSKLEQRLGALLFNREPGALTPTAACLELIEAYRGAADLLGRAVEDVQRARPASITISMPSCAAAAWLSGAFGRLQAQIPDAAVRTHADGEMPDFRRVDVAIIAGGVTPPDGFEGLALFDERVFPVCSPAYAADHDLSTPSAVARLPLLLHSRRAWRSWLNRAGFYSEPVLRGVEIGDPALGMQAALAGQGLFLACTVVAWAAIGEGRLVAPIDVSLPTGRRTWVVWRRTPRPADDLWRFIDWIQAELPQGETGHTELLLDVAA
ncbi:LysR substrate-binding domain-containing protein [Caulobacter sp. KR2-114]|uniref:LysR substrate-binding domain-containing protein n=1 Tax=Caulobacter sp. KR2-114 TaxID=3400912 RepID=UPI003C0181CE